MRGSAVSPYPQRPTYRAYCAVCDCYVPRSTSLAEHLDTRLHITNSHLRAIDPLYRLSDIVTIDGAGTSGGNQQSAPVPTADRSTTTVVVSDSSAASIPGQTAADEISHVELKHSSAKQSQTEEPNPAPGPLSQSRGTNIEAPPARIVPCTEAQPCDRCVSHRIRMARAKRLADEFNRNRGRMLAGRLFLKWHRRWFFAAMRRSEGRQAAEIIAHVRKEFEEARSERQAKRRFLCANEVQQHAAESPTVSSSRPTSALHLKRSAEPASIINAQEMAAAYPPNNATGGPPVNVDRSIKKVLQRLSECAQRHMAATAQLQQCSPALRTIAAASPTMMPYPVASRLEIPRQFHTSPRSSSQQGAQAQLIIRCF